MRAPSNPSIVKPGTRRVAVLVASVALIASILGASSAAAEGLDSPSKPSAESGKMTDAAKTDAASANEAPKLVKATDSDGDKTLDAPDTASAAASALTKNKPVEDLSERTETSTVVVNPDGTRTLSQYQIPVRVKRDGEWLNVDATLAKQSDGTYRPKASASDVVIFGGGTKDAGKVTLGDGSSVTVTWPETLPAPTIEGGVATYKVSATADLLMVMTSDGVAARLRLNEMPKQDDPVFTFGLRSEDVTVTETADGGLALKDDQGKTVGGTSELVAWDAKTDEAGEPLDKVSLNAQLDQTGKVGDVATHELDLTAPEGFLSDPTTKFPVIIDPDIAGLEAARDTWVRQNDPDDHNVWPSLRVGQLNNNPAGNTYAAISYMQWNLGNIPASSTVTDANLFLYQFYAPSCVATAMNIQPVTSAWNASITYLNKPDPYAGDAQVNYDKAGCPGTPAAKISIPAKTWIDNWRNGTGGYGNYGLRLGVPNMNQSDINYQRRICSYNWDNGTTVDPNYANCTNPLNAPSMQVTYNDPPAVPISLDVTNGGNPATVYATLTDGNAEAHLRAQITVRKANSPTIVWQGDSTETTGGTHQVSRRLPYLPDGKYEFTAKAIDDSGFQSAVSSSKSFSIETEFGAQSWLSTTPHSLNDRSSILINNRVGNLVVQANDIKVNGLGLDFNATRFYNSQSVQTNAQGIIPATDRWYTSFGTGWTMSMGPDVWMQKEGTYFYYHAPGGTIFGPFTPYTATKFTSPKGGVGADLSKATVDGVVVYTLKFRKSGLKYQFREYGASGHLFQTKIQDRSDNRIDFNYATTTTPNGRAKLISIKDSSDRDYTVAYTGDYISKITNTDDLSGNLAQAWTYAYESDGRLKSYTNPDQQVTDYEYVQSSETTAKLLSKITDPVNQTGSRPTTTIAYFGNTANADRIDKVTYSGVAQFGWDYKRRATESSCNSGSDYSTTVKDGRSKDTFYCFNNSAGADDGGKVRVYDDTPTHNMKSTQYTADKEIKSVTTPSNQADSSSVTNQYNEGTGATYTDRLNSVTEPQNDGATTASLTQLNYGNSPAAGTEYLPRSVKASDGNCSAYEYDPAGRTTAAYTGIISAANSCAKGAKIGSHRSYNSNGTLNASWDANAYDSTDPTHDDDGEDPLPTRKTIYTYWSSADPGSVDNSSGQLKTVRKPGGSCDAPRKLCTSYTYDLRGNITSITDGRGTKTTYVYDKMDRTIKTIYNGAADCNTGNTNCIRYTYDAEGNMTERLDARGTTRFTYDLLNRQSSQLEYSPGTVPGEEDPDTKNVMGYDENGNLGSVAVMIKDGEVQDLSSCYWSRGYDGPCYDAPWITNYVNSHVVYQYDAANRLTNMRIFSVSGENGSETNFGEIGISPNADGRVQQIRTPGGIRMNYDYTKFGKPKRANVKNSNGTTLREYTYDYKLSVGGDKVMTDKMRNRLIDVVGSAGGSSNNESIDYTYADDQILSAQSTTGPDFEYTHDKIGNVRSEASAGVTTYFGYDRSGQLCWRGQTDGSNLADNCGPGPSGSTNFNHDAAGNNTNTASNPTGYNSDSQVTTIDGVTMAYQDQGNDLRTTAGTTTYINSPLGVSAKKTGNDITFYIRDPNGQLLASHGAGGTLFYFSEFNGSVAAIYNASGTEVGSYTYSPYGKTTVTGAAAQANPFRYIGGLQDKDTQGNDSSYKLGARYYDAQGHFTQPDPIIPGGGTYNYTEGDPINSSDPSGLKPGPDDRCDYQQYSDSPPLRCRQLGTPEDTAPANYPRCTAAIVIGTVSLGFSSFELAAGTALGRIAVASGLSFSALGGSPNPLQPFVNACAP
jgi:RHS repeat-associated protein